MNKKEKIIDEERKAKNREYMKKYMETSETITCEKCGAKYKAYKKYRHEQTQKHLIGQYKKKEENMKEEIDKAVKNQLQELKALLQPITDRNYPPKTELQQEKKVKKINQSK